MIMKHRTIKFKAKRLDNGEWVEGSLLLTEKGKANIGTMLDSNEENGSPVCFQCKEVDPSTICQFTGLTNINGVPIFEGDIIKFGGNAEIIFKNGAFLAKFGEHVECPLYELIKSEESISVVDNKFDGKEEK